MHAFLSYFLPELNFWGDEIEIDNELANHKASMVARGGKLFLTTKRLIFIPNILERLFNARAYTFELNDVENVEIAKAKLSDILGGGAKRRLKIIYKGKVHYFVLNKLDYWENLITKTIQKEKLVCSVSH